MKRTVQIAAALGFMMPILWGFASFLLFNLPQGPAADLYWRVNHIFCPFFLLPTIFELPLTAGLYAFLTYMVMIAIRRLRQRKAA